MSKFSIYSLSLVALWLAAMSFLLVVPSLYLSLICLLLVGLMPFAFFFFGVAFTKPGVWLRGYFSKWHWSVLGALFLIAYSFLGKKWAGDVVNEVFGVDARYFGNTTTLLAWCALPLGVVYESRAIVEGFGLFIKAVSLMVTLGGAWFVVSEGLNVNARFRIGWRALVRFLVVVVVVSAYFGQLRFLPVLFRSSVMDVAVWADFNETHRCGDSWVSSSSKVLFLDGSMVLVAENGVIQMRSCDFKRQVINPVLRVPNLW